MTGEQRFLGCRGVERPRRYRRERQPARLRPTISPARHRPYRRCRLLGAHAGRFATDFAANRVAEGSIQRARAARRIPAEPQSP